MKGAYLLIVRGQKLKMVKDVETETNLLNLLNYTVCQKLKWIFHSSDRQAVFFNEMCGYIYISKLFIK